MKNPEKLAERLNDLLQKNKDSEKGFRNAADDVKDERLKAFLKEKAQERYDFQHELTTEVRSFGDSPKEGSSVKSDAHRTWMDLKSALSGNKEEAVLEEVIKGERLAVEDYKEAIKEKDFPPSTTNMLLKHRNAFQKTINDVKGLEESFS